MNWIQTISFLLLFLMVSCVKQPGNHPPVIESIILDPAINYTPGSDIGVSALVTDKDGDPLEYFWESSGGLIAKPDQASTNWELYTSSEPLTYESVTLTVSDGKEAISKTKTIQVIEGLMMEGYTNFAGTSIPVPGVEVTMGKFSVVSDGQGYYRIEHLKEGSTVVTATKDGYEDFESVVYVDNPKSTYQISLASPTKTHLVSGTIKTVDNIAYEGLKVVLLNPDGSESDLFGFTNDGGAFSIVTVPKGKREILIRTDAPGSHFLNDSVIYQIDLDGSGKSYDARIKIKRMLLSDLYLSEKDLWNFEGTISDGFYLLGKGTQMALKEFIAVPEDAEKAMLFLNSYVVGGCDLVGNLPSHRVWISNIDREYLGGISWGGEGSNFSAQVAWYPSDSPTFINIYGKQIKLHLEVFGENTCVPHPFWRVYQIEFSYYY